jgi:WD40 repeat protein
MFVRFDVQAWKRGTRFKKHTRLLRNFALSADGRRALSSDWGKSVFVWDVAKGETILHLPDHETVVQGLAVSPDGRWGATGGGHTVRADGTMLDLAGFDNVIRLFDLETGKELRNFDQHQGAITCLAFSADGRYLLSGSYDSTVRLWRVANQVRTDG